MKLIHFMWYKYELPISRKIIVVLEFVISASPTGDEMHPTLRVERIKLLGPNESPISCLLCWCSAWWWSSIWGWKIGEQWIGCVHKISCLLLNTISIDPSANAASTSGRWIGGLLHVTDVICPREVRALRILKADTTARFSWTWLWSDIIAVIIASGCPHNWAVVCTLKIVSDCRQTQPWQRQQ